MKRIFTYLIAAGLFILCVLSTRLIPDNMSYGLLSTVKKNSLMDKKALYNNMQSVVESGLIKIELYSQSGELVTTIESPSDFTEELEVLFTSSDLTIKTVGNPVNLQTEALP